MTAITLGFKAFDPHELLCHFLAVMAGYYREENLQVDLADITFTADTEFPPHWFQASCGAALASALKGLGQQIVLVAVERPMFWIYSRDRFEHLADLRHTRIATFPIMAPPHQLANLILRRAGLNVDEEVTLLQARDDTARLGLLRSGSADAAVISSAIAPARMAQLGFRALCGFGDHLRFPSTGLAIDKAFVRQDPEVVEALVRIHRQSLQLIHSDPDRVSLVLQNYFDVDAAISQETARVYAAAFTRDGRISEAVATGAIQSLCDAMAIDRASRPAWNEVYAFL